MESQASRLLPDDAVRVGSAERADRWPSCRPGPGGRHARVAVRPRSGSCEAAHRVARRPRTSLPWVAFPFACDLRRSVRRRLLAQRRRPAQHLVDVVRDGLEDLVVGRDEVHLGGLPSLARGELGQARREVVELEPARQPAAVGGLRRELDVLVELVHEGAHQQQQASAVGGVGDHGSVLRGWFCRGG